MEAHSDEEFDHVRDFDLSDPEEESEAESIDEDEHDTPSTTPPRTRTPRPSDQKTIQCPYNGCEKTFNRNARLQEHIRSHTGERPFRCPHAFCPKAFLRDTHLKHHLTSAHSNVRKYKCTWEGCDKSFATGTRLRRHLQSHEGKEKYRCRGYHGCNETFRKHETLRKHILAIHEEKKPFPCDHVHQTTRETCTKAFDSADKLKSHQRAMHDPSKFSCTICVAIHAGDDVLMSMPDGWQSFSFATFSDLQGHVAEVHPPTCINCAETFVTNKELTRHLELIHGILDTNKQVTQSFPCTYGDCESVFTKRGNLNVHVKTVHGKQKEFVCGSTEVPIPPEMEDQPEVRAYGCRRSFTSKASLIEHIRTAHFSLPSRRSQREAKKKAKRDAEEDSAFGSAPKRRATRKDKGTKKSSTLGAFTGVETPAGPSNPFPIITSFSSTPAVQVRSDDEPMDDGVDDYDELSGSMTMIGDHLYHNGRGYHLVGEDGGTDKVTVDEAQYLPCHTEMSPLDDANTELFFDFEHEREHMQSVLDPMLRT